MLFKIKQRIWKLDKMGNMGIIESVQWGSLHKALSKKLVIEKPFGVIVAFFSDCNIPQTC